MQTWTSLFSVVYIIDCPPTNLSLSCQLQSSMCSMENVVWYWPCKVSQERYVYSENLKTSLSSSSLQQQRYWEICLSETFWTYHGKVLYTLLHSLNFCSFFFVNAWKQCLVYLQLKGKEPKLFPLTKKDDEQNLRNQKLESNIFQKVTFKKMFKFPPHLTLSKQSHFSRKHSCFINDLWILKKNNN